MRLLIVLYPWLELLSIIQLGVETSALFAILWVVGMFFLGTALLRQVGMASLERLREAQRSGGLQQTFFVDDLAVCIAAVLLMIPGLLSDFFAVVVLIGPLRRRLARLVFGAPDGLNDPPSSVGGFGGPTRDTGADRGSVTLEGDYREITEQKAIDESDRRER